MANILFLASRLPYPLYYGDALRIFHLALYLSKYHDCFLAIANTDDANLNDLEQKDIFAEVYYMPARTDNPKWLRHLRLSEASFERLAYPHHYQRVVNFLIRLTSQKRIDVIAACNRDISVFLKPITGIKKVVDACDCKTLSLRRRREKGTFEHHRPSRRWAARMKDRIIEERVKYHESRLSVDFDLVTTVSPVDQKALQDINLRNLSRIVLLPNGVAPKLLERIYAKDPTRGRANSIIFWGNMDFPPNISAVRFFYRSIFMPYLRSYGVTWYIVGSNPPSDILAMDQKEPNIHVTGFVNDLFGLAATIPIMVNPMITGSGLKNKVLEAFALKRLVVSNLIGIEGVPHAVPLEHYVLAEKPVEFANAILYYLERPKERERIGEKAKRLVEEHYTWKRVGMQYAKLIGGLLD